MSPYGDALVEMRGVEPLSNLPYAALSTCLEIVWIFRISAQSQAFNWWFRFVTTALSDVGRCCLFLWCRLLREQKTLGRHAAKLSSECELLRALIFVCVYFLFPFLRRRAYDMLMTQSSNCRMPKHPHRLYYMPKIEKSNILCENILTIWNWKPSAFKLCKDWTYWTRLSLYLPKIKRKHFCVLTKHF